MAEVKKPEHTAVTVPNDLHAQVKAHAEAHGMTVKGLVTLALAAYLQRNGAKGKGRK